MEFKKMDFFPVNRGWLKSIIDESPSDYFFLILIKEKYKKVVVGPDNVSEHDSLTQFIETEQDLLEKKMLLVNTKHNNYELLIFSVKNGQKNVCYFKESKVKLGFMYPSYLKVSLIINNYSMEIFVADFKNCN